MVGLVAGAIRLTLEFMYPAPVCGQPDLQPGVIKHVNYLYFAIISAALTASVAIVISHLTHAIDPKYVSQSKVKVSV